MLKLIKVITECKNRTGYTLGEMIQGAFQDSDINYVTEWLTSVTDEDLMSIIGKLGDPPTQTVSTNNYDTINVNGVDYVRKTTVNLCDNSTESVVW